MSCQGNLGHARDHLAGLGLAIAGARGRFSGDAKEHLNNDLAQGCTFYDWPKDGVKATAIPRTNTSNDNNSNTFVHDPRIAVEPTQLWDETLIKFMGQDGKEIGFKEVCVNCKHSLGWCGCPAPARPFDHETFQTITRRYNDGRIAIIPNRLEQ